MTELTINQKATLYRLTKAKKRYDDAVEIAQLHCEHEYENNQYDYGQKCRHCEHVTPPPDFLSDAIKSMRPRTNVGELSSDRMDALQQEHTEGVNKNFGSIQHKA